ncbi:hypothetical protein PoB_004858400 [Plakobranchus ocellatus]|uniref:Uncharacterized protein n=1 Tax=Plakobranchus ocellatus TaxID=259542 RepID=A0AAV4BUL9_9GAST|nr:hypothetical protein PoB_004858400 [Plakobranchus ocellatus]
MPRSDTEALSCQTVDFALTRLVHNLKYVAYFLICLRWMQLLAIPPLNLHKSFCRDPFEFEADLPPTTWPDWGLEA